MGLISYQGDYFKHEVEDFYKDMKKTIKETTLLSQSNGPKYPIFRCMDVLLLESIFNRYYCTTFEPIQILEYRKT